FASGAQQQAASLEETAASLAHITSMVDHTAANARQASQLAVGTHDSAMQGEQVVTVTRAAMQEITQASTKITNIMSVLDGITFQTNLLALNAAIEAARAGEQGRGFAVVATEVRRLAQRSSEAAKEIQVLLADAGCKVHDGSVLVCQSGQTLKEIVTAAQRVTDIIAAIAVASQEQAASIKQVSQAVTQIDQITQANATQTGELAGTVQILNTQAQKLEALVGRFKLSTTSAMGDAKSMPDMTF